MAESGEGLWMSARERDRLKVLHEVRQRHITQAQAGAELGMSVRWVRKLLVRLRTWGDGGLRHGLRGRRSNRKTPEAAKGRAVELYRQKKQAKLWHDYGPTLAAEELAEQHGIAISRETLRQWLIEAKLWKPHRARVEQAHVWRARRARYGELVQWDTSEHDWLEGRGEKLYLIGMIDDATSQLTARFVRHDSTEENLRQLRHYIEQHGRPISVYTDKASLFQIAPRASQVVRLRVGDVTIVIDEIGPLSFMVRRREPWDWESGPVLMVLLLLHRGDLFAQNQPGDRGPAVEMNPSGDRRNPGFVAQEQ